MKNLIRLIQWIISIILLFASFGGFLSGEYIQAGITLMIGLVIFPPVTKKLFKKKGAAENNDIRRSSKNDQVVEYLKMEKENFDLMNQSDNEKKDSEYDIIFDKMMDALMNDDKKEYLYYKEKYDQHNQRIKEEFENQDKEFNELLKIRQKAKKLEKDNRLEEAIELYKKSIDFGENSESISNRIYEYDIQRIIILLGKLKRKDDLIIYLNHLLQKYPDTEGVSDWSVRLSKLTNSIDLNEIDLSPDDIKKQYPGVPTIGEKINNFLRTMPEFNFYYDLPEGMDTMSYNINVPREYFNKLREFRNAFEIIKDKAKIAENQGNFKTAIEAYEKLIVEEYENPDPYERLMIIYSKLKWKDHEMNTIQRAIDFFSKLKEKQKNYVMTLAQKYGMEGKALEYINQNKKVFYYHGAFELYNPQGKRLEKWKERINKYQ